MISKVTPRSRNSAADKRYVTPDQYTDAVNIRVENSYSESGENSSGNVGVIKPVKGNKIVGGANLSQHRILGKVHDYSTDIIYFAAASPNASENGVFMVDPKTANVSAIVQTAFFAWDGVSHVDMTITKSRDGDAIVYLTDGVNEPYKVDVKIFTEGQTQLTTLPSNYTNQSIEETVGRRVYDAITVCPITPNKPITASFTYDPSSGSSNFKNLPGIQLAYQNIYETGEISALSSYSDVLVPPSYLTQGSGTLESLDTFNRLDIVVPGQPTSVVAIKLLIRFGESGSWFVIEEIDRPLLNARIFEFDLERSFYNDEILSQLPENESKRFFDSVPTTAATNEVQEDRLFYGNYTEGRNNSYSGSNAGATRANLSVIYEDRPDDFDPISIDIEPEVIPLTRKDANGEVDNAKCRNRVAGFKVSIGSNEGNLIPAGSTVVFDFTCAPDKNFHIYESSHSFHANTEIYDFDDLDSTFHSNYNRNALDRNSLSNDEATKSNWVRSIWGFADEAMKTGIYEDSQPPNFRYGVSDDVITGNTATWEVKAGPLNGLEIPVVYGSSPATPLILRGGEISFSVRFRLLRDMTISDTVKNVIKFLNEDPTAGYDSQFNPGIGEFEQIQIAQLIDSQVRGGYSIDMGVGEGGVRRFSRNSSVADVICCVGDREWASSFGSGSNVLDLNVAANPVGYFMVDQADVEFKVRDVSDLVNLGGGEDFYLALDITSVDNVSIATMIPVFEIDSTSATTLTADPIYKGSKNKWDNGGAHEGSFHAGIQYGPDTTIQGPLYPIHHGNVVNAWVGFGPRAGGSFPNPDTLDFNSLFDCLYESTSGPTYKRLFTYDDISDTFKDILEDHVLESGGDYDPIWRNLLMWVGRLNPASTSSSSVPLDLIGGTDGSSATASSSRRLLHTYESSLTRALNSGEFDASDESSQTYANFAFSMVDGEGGIGGWRGSMLQTADIISGKLIQRSKEDDPDNWIDPDFSLSDDQLANAFRRFTDKIEGSVTSSIIFEGSLKPTIRFIADDRVAFDTPLTATWSNPKGFYPDMPVLEGYGPLLAGVYYPFQYLHQGGVDIAESNEGIQIFYDQFIGLYDVNTDFWQGEIIKSFTDDPDDYWPGVRGYLKHDQGEGDLRPSSVEMISDNTYILSSDQGAETSRSFKRSSNHNLGMVYYDYFGRPGTVIPFPSVYVAGYADAELPAGTSGQGPTRIKVDFSLSNIPEWAHSYKFVYGGNSTTRDFVQYTSGGAFVAVNTGEDDQDQVGNIYVSLNYLQSNPDVSYAKAFGAVSELGDKDIYKFSGGDKLKVISYFGGDDLETRQFPVGYEFDIVEVTTLTDDPSSNPLWNIEDGDEVPKYLQGQFVVVKNNPTASMFTYASVRNAENASETTQHKWNDRTIIELYKPKSTASEEELIYREIGDAYRIVNNPFDIIGPNGETTTVYQRDHEFNSHEISQGDVWFRRIAMNIAKFSGGIFRNIIRASNSSSPRFFDYYVESNRFTDQFADSRTVGKGKPLIYSPEAREISKPSSIIFSNINTKGSRYNRLSTFDATTANFKEIPNEHGDIKTMIKDGDSLAVFQESKMSMLPINRSVLTDASDNSSLIASSKTIGNQVFIPGNFGVGDSPESVLYVDGYIYFANPTRREVYKYSPGKGVATISDAGMEDYFYNLFSSDPSSSKVVSAFDYKNDEFVIDYASPISPIIYNASDNVIYPELPIVQSTSSRVNKRVPSLPISLSSQAPSSGLVLSPPPRTRVNMNNLSPNIKKKLVSAIKRMKPSFRNFNKNRSFFERRSREINGGPQKQ